MFVDFCKKTQQSVNCLEKVLIKTKINKNFISVFFVSLKLYFFIFFRALLRVYAFLFVEDPSHFFVLTGAEKNNMYFTQSTYCAYKRFQKKTNGFSKPVFIAIIIASVATSFFLYFLMNVYQPDSSNYPTYAAGAAWYDSGWIYRKQIIVNRAKIADTINPSESYANFPLLISINALSNINANGADIRFTSSDGATELPREIESYSSGSLKVWVKINLTKGGSGDSDNIIYMYYGNSGAVEPAANSIYGSQNVWKANGAVMIQHMKDTAVFAMADSTISANNGTKKAANEPAEVDGKIGKGQSFDGVDDYIDAGTGVGKPSDWTIIAWIKPNGWGIGSPVFSADSGANIGTRWGIYLGDDQTFRIYTSDGVNQDGSYIMDWNSINYPSDRFTFIGAAVKGTNKKFYRNGVLVGSNTASIVNKGTPYGLSIGKFGENSRAYFNGSVDEVRVFDRALSDQEIAAYYDNQNNPSDFYVLGKEETADNIPGISL